MHSIQILKLYLVPNASNSTSIKSTRELYKASLDRNANDRDALVSCLRGCLTYQNNNTGRPSAAKKNIPIYIYIYVHTTTTSLPMLSTYLQDNTHYQSSRVCVCVSIQGWTGLYQPRRPIKEILWKLNNSVNEFSLHIFFWDHQTCWIQVNKFRSFSFSRIVGFDWFH